MKLQVRAVKKSKIEWGFETSAIVRVSKLEIKPHVVLIYLGQWVIIKKIPELHTFFRWSYSVSSICTRNEDRSCFSLFYLVLCEHCLWTSKNRAGAEVVDGLSGNLHCRLPLRPSTISAPMTRQTCSTNVHMNYMRNGPQRQHWGLAQCRWPCFVVHGNMFFAEPFSRQYIEEHLSQESQ